jgi:hypothetical protein
MKTHPVADLYPLNQENVDAIAADIKANGQKLPILTLGDGRIVDGRNRYMACQKLGITPKTECIENGKTLSDEELITIARSYNEKRRQLSKMQAACVAALEWKMLHPGENRRRHVKGDESAKMHFHDFAAINHGVGERYAKQALAVANWNIERLRQAKEDPRGLADAYEDYKAAVSEEKLKARREKVLQEHEDIFDRYQSGQLSLDEAFTLANERNQERDEKESARKGQAERVVRSINDFIAIQETPTALRDAIKTGLITDDQLIEYQGRAAKVLKQIKAYEYSMPKLGQGGTIPEGADLR